MKENRWSRFVGSPVLLVVLLLVGSALAIASYRVTARNLPPQIEGYNWAKYPDTLLLSVPAGDCGCGLPLTEWMSMGAAHHLQVLVISAQPNEQVAALKKTLVSKRFTFLTDVKKEVIQSLSPKDQVTVLLIRNGRIVKKLESGMPPTTFFN